jgi:mannose PTS system EIIA component
MRWNNGWLPSMASILVIAHQPLAGALVEAARHVYSRNPLAATREMRHLDVDPDCDPEAVLAQARAIVAEIDQGRGVLVLTDLLGATPGNIARQLAEPGRVEVLAGVSMPMLLRSVCYCGEPLASLATKALDGGLRGMESVLPRAAGATPEAPTAGAGSARGADER